MDGVLGVASALTVMLLFFVHQAASSGQGRDLLRGVPWRTSSSYQLRIAPQMFFHTDEEASPSITYAFPEPTAVSSLVVRNSPWFPERAAPLVAEVSVDGETFQEVARTEHGFVTWQARFAKRKVRFLRLRATKRTWLHLKSVEAHA